MFANKKINVLLAILFALTDVFCQDTISIQNNIINSISVDFNEDIYIVEQYKITKYTNNYKKSIEYSSQQFGEIASIDVSNPFKIIVFFKESSTVILLDNQLKQIALAIRLQQYTITNAELICFGSGNSFWIYSADNKKITKYDFTFNKISSTHDLSGFLQQAKAIKSITERGNKLFVVIENTGILLFSNDGTYINTLYFQDFEHLYVVSDTLICVFKSNKSIQLYDIVSMKFQDLNIKWDNSIDYKYFVTKKTLYKAENKRIIKSLIN